MIRSSLGLRLIRLLGLGEGVTDAALILLEVLGFAFSILTQSQVGAVGAFQR